MKILLARLAPAPWLDRARVTVRGDDIVVIGPNRSAKKGWVLPDLWARKAKPARFLLICGQGGLYPDDGGLPRVVIGWTWPADGAYVREFNVRVLRDSLQVLPDADGGFSVVAELAGPVDFFDAPGLSAGDPSGPAWASRHAGSGASFSRRFQAHSAQMGRALDEHVLKLKTRLAQQANARKDRKAGVASIKQAEAELAIQYPGQRVTLKMLKGKVGITDDRTLKKRLSKSP